MNRSDKTLCLLFRQPVRFFSIERVFRCLRPELEKRIAVSSWVASRGKASLPDILLNMLAARKSKADILHITGDIHYVALALPARKTLLTIHDCVFLYRSRGLKRLLLKWLFLDLPVRHCRLITTISEATRADILRFTGCAPEKVVIVPDPLDDMIRYHPRPFPEKDPVVLFIGSTPHKNLDRVIQALEGISCTLRIIGKPSASARAALDQYRIKYVLRSGLTDEEMADCYTTADLVIFPSTFEGFGLPIIEAQQAGRPVITSDLSPMRDVAGGAACLVDPYDIQSIRSAVLRLIADAPYRASLVEKGLDNVRRFDAATVARQYIDCYHQLLKL